MLLVCTTFLIVYLFPKSGKFKYNFEKGKPWQSENLYAPFDFAIKKSDAEITMEKKTISENALVYFSIDSVIHNQIDNLYDVQFHKVFKDTIPKKDFEALYVLGKRTINEIYQYGVLVHVEKYHCQSTLPLFYQLICCFLFGKTIRTHCLQ